MTIQLRDFQTEAVDALLTWWSMGNGHGLLVLPTGAGKSIVAGELMRQLYIEHGTRVVCASHVQELLQQDCEALQSIWPEAPCGIWSAGLGRADCDAPLLFAGVQTLYRDPSKMGVRHVLLIDEAHLLSRKDSGMYQKVIAHMRDTVPGFRIGGLTATPFRLQDGRLDEPYGNQPAMFDGVAYEVPILDMIKRGYLVPVLPYMSPQRIDTSSVRTSGGEYIQKELQAAVDKDDINARVVKEIVAAGENRSLWLVFAAGVEHTRHLRDLFRSEGIDAEMVTGETPAAERESIFSRARSGNVRCLVGANVMTTGLNLPAVDLIAMVRPTKSLSLWIQMIGRGMRLAPGKSDCLLLDFTSNTTSLGCVDMIDGSKQPSGKGTAPVKECESCHHVCHISAKACPQCGAPFPIIDELKHTSVSGGKPIFSTQVEPAWMDVDQIVFRRHQKPGSPDSLRIDYSSGMSTFSEWLALEHENAAGMARRTWERMSYSQQAPRSVDEALTRLDDIRVPGRIQVFKEGKHWRIIHKDFSIPPGKVIPIKRALPSAKFHNWRSVEQPKDL